MNITIVIAATVVTIISFLFDKNKTLQGIKRGALMFLKILPVLLSVMILISVALYFVSSDTLTAYLGNKAGVWAYASAAVIGAVSIIPSFISYPLAGVLVKTGVSYGVIAVFINTLKMVGILTIPIEAKFLGYKMSILRNILAFTGALVVGILMALIYGIT
jgi:uncharacterized membrane protein YraQ (UPF0718 family)